MASFSLADILAAFKEVPEWAGLRHLPARIVEIERRLPKRDFVAPMVPPGQRA
jgi:hypothetical protein